MQQLPRAFLSSLHTVKGFDEKAFISVHNSGEQITSIRLNPAKPSIFNIPHSKYNKVPWSAEGYYLAERPSFTADPFFHAGAYYVQEPSSMFLEEVMRQVIDLSGPLRVLDLCAAPGGKSTLLQSVISAESLLVSNEIIKARVNILTENITKWGAANVIVTNNDAKDMQRLGSWFDAVVIDAPCSGSGLFRKDPQAINEWSTANVEMCSIRQQSIVKDILPSLKPGGILIYSTCSYSSEEDEQIADFIVEQGLEPVPLQVPGEWNIIETFSSRHNSAGYRFYPDKLIGEGFYIAAFKKKEGEISETRISKNKLQLVSSDDKQIISPFINNINALKFFYWNNEILAIPANRTEDVLKLQSALYIKKAGIKIGSIKQGELIPDHELAVSSILSTSIAGIEVDLTVALEYLRRHDVKTTVNRKGWMVIKYNGMPLGWIKNIGSRVNNYYPKEWRILNK